MSKISRRAFVTTGLAAAGVAGLATAAGLAKRYGLVPPDSGGIWGPGETLTYAAQRLITTHSMAREFPRSRLPTNSRRWATTLSATRAPALPTGAWPWMGWSRNPYRFLGLI